MKKELKEFLVQGDEVQSPTFEDLLKQNDSIELVATIAKDVVVLRMAVEDRDAIAGSFGNLIIEPNSPLERL